MSKLHFRNCQHKSIRRLLSEIGKERYELALKDQKFLGNPLALDGFSVEYEIATGNIGLYFKFPLSARKFIMDVRWYKLPLEGWELVRIDHV